MSMYGRDPWGGPLEINTADSATDDDRSRNLQDFDRAALSRPLDETQQSWLLGPTEQKKKKYVDLGCIIVSRKIFVWTVGTILASAVLAGFITLIVKTVPRHHHSHDAPDNYTLALHKALMFFNAQKCQLSFLSFDFSLAVFGLMCHEQICSSQFFIFLKKIIIFFILIFWILIFVVAVNVVL